MKGLNHLEAMHARAQRNKERLLLKLMLRKKFIEDKLKKLISPTQVKE